MPDYRGRPGPSRDAVDMAEALALTIRQMWPGAKTDTTLTWGTTMMVHAFFPNGWGLSIICGPHTYGGAQGFFEVAILDPAGDLWKHPQWEDTVLGWQTAEQVGRELERVRAYPRMLTLKWRWGKFLTKIRLAYKKWKEARP